MSRIRNGLPVLALVAALTACGHSAPTPVDAIHRESNGPALVLETSKISHDDLPTVTVSAKRDANSKPQI
jgi:hypothetical protein